MHAHLAQPLYVGHGAQIFGVHDVSAVLVLKGGHVFAGTHRLFQHKYPIGRRAFAQRRCNGGDRNGLILMNDIARIILFAFLHLIFPAAGVGAGSLIGIAFIDVTGQQTAAGIGHAEGAVDKDFQLHLRHLLTNLRNLLQRQFARQNHPRQPHLLPEFHRRPVYRVGLHRQMNRHLGEGLTHQHDQAGIGHDQGVWLHGDHRRQIADKSLQLGVMGRDVDHHVEFFAQLMRLGDTDSQILMGKFIVSHAQAVTWLAGIYRVCAIGKRITHVFQRPGRREQFRFKHNVSV